MNPPAPDNPRVQAGDDRLHRLIEEAILEDLGTGDITTDAIVSEDDLGRGEVRVKEGGVIAGLSVAGEVFRCIDEEIQWKCLVSDGSRVEAGTVVAAAEGALAGLLKAERTALNILQRMSGIATLTARYVEAVKGTQARITDTRKTPPGLRILDKLAVKIGGGINHRFGLDDMVLIKDNHIAAAGGIGPAVQRCLDRVRGMNYRVNVEVETRNVEEVTEVLKFSGVDRIMLDHFSIEMMKRAVGLINRRAEVEASGNVSLEDVRPIAETGVDVISVGALTHSPRALDISMKIIHTPNSRR
ncbi:MAG TPA: carboxylating nicotinate-nucleotide diphosphorylase [Bacteroidota bacterium]|nr:carboxylating nicotinate-nucleotide diphosphorylase [Bacteroidota bacterium]